MVKGEWWKKDSFYENNGFNFLVEKIGNERHGYSFLSGVTFIGITAGRISNNVTFSRSSSYSSGDVRK